MPATWPQEGRIVFQNVYLRYAPDEPPVIKDLNVVVECGWKVISVTYLGCMKLSQDSFVYLPT